MKKLYPADSANFPRLETDVLFVDYNNTYHFDASMHKLYAFLEDEQLKNKTLWNRFVQQFKIFSDTDKGWRGEYWGKMMRGAAFVYSYTQDEELYSILTDTVRDMISAADASGRISTYPLAEEFDGWDMWCRKYVLLGMQYYLEICKDENLSKEIVASMCRQMDYILSHVGPEGKPINQTCNRWRGLNSSSILEPVVRLYSLTGIKKYLEFASYIVECGGMDIFNIFEAAYEDKFRPYQYPMTKAYEMISCFEGLLEYYRVTKDERWKTSVVNFANRVLEYDYTVIGGCGTTSEVFDHSTVRQANTTNKPVKQETCVTVTFMKFMYQLHLLTGDVKYADAFERSFYNAYLGSLNTEKLVEPFISQEHPDWIIEPLPFDSYSPLTVGSRGYKIGGVKQMPDSHYYGCCACIGSAGAGLVPKMQLLTKENSFVLNLFIGGKITSTTPDGQSITFHIATDYPRNGKAKVCVSLKNAETFTLLVRNPAWSKQSTLKVGDRVYADAQGYFSIEKQWQDGDTIELELDMTVRVIRPIPYGQEILMNKAIGKLDYVVPTYDIEDPLAKKHVALQRGPVMLAQDNTLGYNAEAPVSICISSDETVAALVAEKGTAPYINMIEIQVPLENGNYMTVTDYASAGKLWSKTKVAVWMLID